MKGVVLLLLFWVLSCAASAQEQAQQRPKVGLVLSGGGAKGFAHIGVLKVLQESGLEVDYIAGTSMGAIMGGLYAIGYSPESLEQMVSEQNWPSLIMDSYPRKYLNIDEKGTDEKFFLNVPFTKKGFQLPSGIVEAQEVSLLFSSLCSPAYRTREFEELQTPFLCVGACLEEIAPIVLESGDLPYALRSSMAILGFFSPTEYDGHLLTDGGLVDNFPVLELKKRGVDIIIGIDVQSPRLERAGLKSLTSDIWHVIDKHSLKAQLDALKETDIYIHPDITGYDMMSFNSWDSLIRRGEQMGKTFLPQLKALADSLNAIEYKPMKERSTRPLDSVYIEKVEYVGLRKVPRDLLDSYKGFSSKGKVALSDIELWIHLLRGTKYFDLLRYELYPCEKGAILRLHVKESVGQSVGVSLHFDSDYKASINLRGTLRNWLIHGSKAEIIFGLGENFLFNGNVSVNRGRRLSFGGDLGMEALNMYHYDAQGNRNSMFRFVDMYFSPYAKFLFRNYLDIGLGVDIEYTGQKPVVDYLSFDRINDGYFNINFFSKLDTRNSLFYSTQGTYLSLTAKMVKGISGGFKGVPLYWFGAFNWTSSFSLSPRFAVRPGINLVATTDLSSKNLPSVEYKPYQAYLGGMMECNVLPGLVPFTGLQNMYFTGNYAYVASVDLQYRIYKQRGFLIATINAGNIESKYADLFNSDMFKRNFTIGYGLTAAYNSFIGPISLSVTGCNKSKGVGFFINIGYKI